MKNLTSQANSKIYSQNAESTDILASLYIPAAGFEKNTPLKFLIFSTLNEAADLKNNLKYIFIVIGVCGVILSLILTFLFTDKLRKQITQLSKATEFTKEGIFNKKIEIKSKDELRKACKCF